jgi:hypothetical protein
MITNPRWGRVPLDALGRHRRAAIVDELLPRTDHRLAGHLLAGDALGCRLLARSRARIARARPALTAPLFGIVCAMTGTAKVSVMSGATFTSRVMRSAS